MGSELSNDQDGEKPVQVIYVDIFEIGRYEVTNRQYAQCVKARICSGLPKSDEYHDLNPVSYVSWYDAQEFCAWVGGRLPTEAEWEKAASWDENTKTKRLYPWGNNIDCSFANYSGKDQGQACIGALTPVGSYEKGKSPYGIYDMAGNAWEWTSGQYQYHANVGDVSSPDERALRGGAFNFFDHQLRTFTRDGLNPNTLLRYIGFRCAHDVP